MKSKVTEVGVFTAGVGVVFTAVVIVLQATNRERQLGFHVGQVLVYVPGLVLAALGAWVLIARSNTSLAFSTAGAGVTLLVFSLLPPNVISLGFTALVVFVLSSTTRKAMDELAGKAADQPKRSRFADKLLAGYEEADQQDG